MRRSFIRLNPAVVIATAALVVALTGVSAAAGSKQSSSYIVETHSGPQQTLPYGGFTSTTARCPKGSQVTGGGGESFDGWFAVTHIRPENSAGQWPLHGTPATQLQVEFANYNTGSDQAATPTVYVICKR